jgi:hypothetical protein
MNAKRITLASTAAIVALLTTAAAALAQPGVATSPVNVRTGPGTNYAKIGVLSAGEYVDVLQCQGSWCYVDRNSGSDGWVSANYLKPVNAPQPGPAPAPSNPDIPFSFGFSFGEPGGPQVSIGIGNAPPPAPVTPRVCFYKGADFSGAQYCVNPGDADPVLPGSWDNAISSIKVQGGAEVTVCKGQWYNGACATVSASKASLGSFNNAISSFQAY